MTCLQNSATNLGNQRLSFTMSGRCNKSLGHSFTPGDTCIFALVSSLQSLKPSLPRMCFLRCSEECNHRPSLSLVHPISVGGNAGQGNFHPLGQLFLVHRCLKVVKVWVILLVCRCAQLSKSASTSPTYM